MEENMMEDWQYNEQELQEIQELEEYNASLERHEIDLMWHQYCCEEQE